MAWPAGAQMETDRAMPRRAQTFRKGDVAKALKAALRRDPAAASRRRTMRDDLVAELSLRKRAEAAG